MRAHVVIYSILFTLIPATGMSMALAQDNAPGLRQAFESAWLRSPVQHVLDARRDEVVAGQEAARSWTAGSPVVGLAQRSDRLTDDRGARETELSLSAPLWLPGQKAARQQAARIGAGYLDAEIAQARLAIAGDVRERLWAVAAAREMAAEAEQHHHHLAALAQDVTRRVGAGELARTDGLLATQEVLKAQAGIHAAHARLQEARTRYTALTGLPDIPVPEPEAAANLSIEQHPKLHAARRVLERAQATGRVVASNRSDPPTIGLSMRREQEAVSGGLSRSLGIALQIPIGTAARNRPLDTAAFTQVQTASAELMQIGVALQAEIDIAGQQLRTAQQTSETASAQAALLGEHTALLEKAFRLGEGSLPELLRAQASLHEIRVAVRQQDIAVGLSRARLNQAIGVFP